MNSRIAENSSTHPTSTPNQRIGSWILPPTNAIGTAVTAKGQNNRQ